MSHGGVGVDGWMRVSFRLVMGLTGQAVLSWVGVGPRTLHVLLKNTGFQASDPLAHVLGDGALGAGIAEPQGSEHICLVPRKQGRGRPSV